MIAWALLSDYSYATHAAGADLTYECLGGNTYRFTLAFYRDCGGVNADNTYDIDLVANNCNGSNYDLDLTLNQVSVTEITPLCPTQESNCGNGNITGIQEYIYQGTITLPAACDNWTFTFCEAARNNIIDVIQAPGGQDLCVEATLDNLNAPCNSSPYFTNEPVGFICSGTEFCFNHGTLDDDGDSLVFTPIIPLNGPSGSTVNYVNPFNVNQPLPTAPELPYSVDPVSGTICFKPNQAIVSVVAIRIDEYRNGQLIGSVIRDIQLNISNCNNQNPTIYGFDNQVANGTNTSTTECAGTNVNFVINAADPDINQNLTLSWNGAIPGATFTDNGNGTADFNWTSSPQDAGTTRCFTVTAEDDYCPYIGSFTTQFCIELIGGTLIVNGEQVDICGDMEVQLEATGGSVFYWTAISGDPIQVGTNFSCNPCASPMASPNQTTEYMVNSDLSNGICTDKDTIEVVYQDNIGNMTINTNNDTLLCPDECVNLVQNGTVADTIITPVTFDEQPGAVINNWNDPSSTINVNGVNSGTVYPGSIASICFDIEHTFDADLDIYIECPNGTMLELTTDNGGGNDDYIGTCFTPTAVTPINFGFPPFSGNYIPEGGNIDTQLAGCPTNGPWTLHVSDDANGHHGTLNNWSITFNDTVINSAPASNFEWADGSGAVISNNSSHQICPTGNDFYVATIYDDMNCFIKDTVQVNVNPPIIVDANINPENCVGNNGSIDVAVNGGVPPYNYNWIITGAQTEDINGLSSGTYILEITDASPAQCVKTDTFFVPIIDNAPVIDNISVNHESCIDLNDGNATANTSNGNAPLNFTINGVPNPNNVFNNLSDQNYEVIVTDALGCDDTMQFVVNPGIDINFQAQSYIASCEDNNGAINIDPSGGSNYQYSIDNGQTFVSQDSFPNLAAGQYDVIVQDISGCADSGIVNVNNSPSQIIDSIVTLPVSCNGGNDGIAQAYLSHGNPPLLYSIDNGQTTQNNGQFANLPAGNYNLWTQDGFGCLALQTFEIVEPDPIQANVIATDVLCYNACDGTIAVQDTTGGNGNFTVQITGPGGQYANFSVNNLCDGNYDIMITDAKNCIYNTGVSIQEPQPLVVNVTTDSTTCFNGNDGSAQANVNGGTAPYQYVWNTNSNSSSIQNLSAGNYSVQVTDDNGCMTNANGNVTDATPMQFIAVNVQDEICYNACDGEIDISATQAAQFFVNGIHQNNGLYTDLCPGNYNIVVKNQHGCQIDSNVNIASQNPIVVDPITDTTICYSGQATLDAMVNGNNNGFTFNWYNNNNLIHTGPQVTVNPTYQTTYEVVATDVNGCNSDALNVQVVVLPPIQVTAYKDTSLCEGGEVSLEAYVEGGDGNYTYAWTSTQQNSETAQSFTYTGTISENWTVEVTDGCETPMTEDHVSIVVNPNPNVDFSVEDPTVCIPEAARFTNHTDLPGTATWSFGNGEQQNGWDGAVTYRKENCYDVTLEVVTTKGCYGSISYNDIVCTKLPPVADFSYNPKEVLITDPTVEFFNQSLGATSYWWDLGDGDTSIAQHPIHSYTPDVPGDYPVYLVATNEYGCTDTTLQTIHVEEDVLVYVPNAFTPDGNGRNDFFMPVVSQDFDPQSFTFYVFNRWGEVLFESHNQQIGWDGTYLGDICKQDVYVWQVSFKERDTDKKYEFRGHFTLLK